MARAIWKGNITFGLVNIPVNLFSAENPAKELHFKMLDNRNKARVKYERVNEATGEEVPWDQIVKAYDYGDENYVVMTDEELQRAAVEATQSVEIEDFIDADQVSYVFFEKPYYMTPGKKGEKGYVLLRESLKKTKKMGIAKVVLRSKQYLCAVAAQDDALIMNTLRFAHELRDISEFELPTESLSSYKITDREMDMSKRLVEAMTAEWQPKKYTDDYYDRIMEWIKKRAEEGETAEPPAAAEKPEAASVVDIMDLLKRSVEETEKGRKKPTEEKTEKKEKATTHRKRAVG